MATTKTYTFVSNILTVTSQIDFTLLPTKSNLDVNNISITDITPNSVNIKIDTSAKELTIYKISFIGRCSSEGCEIRGNEYKNIHDIKISGLEPDYNYVIQISAFGRTGNEYISSNLNIKTLPNPNVLPIPTTITTPSILSVYSNIERKNITEKDTLLWDFNLYKEYTLDVAVNPSVTNLKYFFKNQIGADAEGFKTSNIVDQKGKIVLNFPNEYGNYELLIIASNPTIPQQIDTKRYIFNVSQIKGYFTPVIKQVTGPSFINEGDALNFDYTFDFFIQHGYVNNQILAIYLNSTNTNPIYENPTPRNRFSTDISLKRSELLPYLERIPETFDPEFDRNVIKVTFIIQLYINTEAGKLTSIGEGIDCKIVKSKYTLDDTQAINKLTEPFTKLFSGNDTKKDFEDKINFEDDKYFYYRIRNDIGTEIKSYPVLNIAEDKIKYSKDGENIVKTQFTIDAETGASIRVQKTPYSTLVVKLAEPLPLGVNVLKNVWIAKQLAPTIIQDIVITETSEESLPFLKPNFTNEELEDGEFQFYGQLVAEGEKTTNDIVNTFLSGSEFDLTKLNIQYTSGSDISSDIFIVYKNFVNFSSAKSRLNNYQYKLNAIEFYTQKISSSLYVGNTISTSSYSILTSESYNNIINGIKNKFDGFEKELYKNYNITSSNATFFDYQAETAELYDKENKNYLVRNIPTYLTDSPENEEFILFLEMIGQHFDVLWCYINGIKNKNNISDVSKNSGVSDELIYYKLKDFGWDPKMPFKSTELWREAFGTLADGTTPSNTNQLGNSITPTYTTKQARNEIWRRILNNIPYLLKNKGTKRAINAILTCYGVPSSLLTIVEFGGPSTKPLSSSKYTYDDRTAALNLSPTEYITIPWVSSSVYEPTCVQTRFKTEYKIPNATSITGSQLIRKERTGGGYWQVNVVPNFTSSFGDVVFTLKNSTNTETISLVVSESVLFDDYWKNITIQKERFVSNSINYDRFNLYVKEALDDRIIMNESASAIHTSSAVTNIFTDTGNLYINATNPTKGIDGSYDEIRIWGKPLSESIITAHTLNPDVIYGNGVYSTTEDLLLRLDFEWPKDRIADPYIKNVSPSITFSGSNAIGGYIGYATASITTVATSYPYQYEVYERSVTATVPTIGFVPSDKIRFEDIELKTNLSHKARASVKSFDRAPVDSNRLGLFFSPVKELNLDILKSLGPINIGDYIGDWQDEYGTDRYKDLDTLRNYYFKRTNLSFEEYIKLIKSVDKSLFDMLKQVIPARAKVTQGLLLESSLLERSKIKITKPTANKIFYSSSIDIQDTSQITAKYDQYNSTLTTNLDKNFTASLSILESIIEITDEITINSSNIINETELSIIDNINLNGNIIKNSISTMGGLEVEIDTRKDPVVVGEYDLELGYEAVGMDKDSPFTAGYGIIGQSGFIDRTYFKNDGTLILTERKNAYILTVKYTRDVPNTNISGITTYEKIDKFKKKLIIVDSEILSGTTVKSATAHSFYTNIATQLGTYPFDKGVVTEIYPFDGMTYGHYKFVKDTTKGVENSFYNGSKQSSSTTIDGSPAVEVFTTNPNVLKVSDAGRGSGEPILEID